MTTSIMVVVVAVVAVAVVVLLVLQLLLETRRYLNKVAAARHPRSRDVNHPRRKEMK